MGDSNQDTGEAKPEPAGDPSWSASLAFALQLSLGAYFAVPALAYALCGAFLLTLPTEFPQGAPLAWIKGTLLLCGGLIPGLGLLRFKAWGRFLALALSGGYLLSGALQLGADSPLGARLVGLLAVHALLLCTPRVAASALAESKAPRNQGLVAPVYASALAWLVVWCFGMQLTLRPFVEIFASMVALPVLTKGVRFWAILLPEHWPLSYLALILIPLPLLRLPEARRKLALGLVNGAGALGLVAIFLAVRLPIVGLQNALKQ